MNKTQQPGQDGAHGRFYKDMGTARKQNAAHKDFYGATVTTKQFNHDVIPLVGDHGETQ